jgi:hypothetical protein
LNITETKCGNCKYWIEPENSYGEIPGIGQCEAVVEYWDAGEWDNDGETRKLKPRYKEKLAFVQDGSDYSASLHTFSEFGCVQFVKKGD